MKNLEAILKFVHVEKLQTVIEDLRLMEEGYKIYYAVDPHEIFNFCFPLRTTDSDQTSLEDMDEFAAEQAALYEVCFKHSEKPLLIGDYVDELNGLIRYSKAILDDAYDAALVVDQLIDKGGIEKIADEAQTTEENMSDTVQTISEKFHIVLAVAMGIYSLGSARFQKIYRDLVIDENGLPEKNSNLREHFETYRESDLSDEIMKELMKGYADSDESEYRRKRRSAFFDARAIDQLAHVNGSLMNQSSGSRGVVLYLSSAPRTERAFQMKSTQRHLPLLKGEPFNFHRDRKHVFYRIAYRSNRGTGGTIENLETVKRSIEDLKASVGRLPLQTDRCADCVLDGRRPVRCENQTACERLLFLVEPLEQRSTEVRNLAFTQTLGRYKELKKARPEGASQKRLMEFFCRVFEDQQLKNVARQKKLHKQQLILLQLGTPKNWARSREASRKQHLRAGRDTISGTVQYLPLNPRVESERYKEIVSQILDYFKTPPQGDESKIEVIDQAYRLYLDQEAAVTDLEAEHELVRCLLYLTLPGTEGDRKALDHAQDMLDEPTVLSEVPASEAEFRYIACWSARRLKKFENANKHATEAIALWPTDPRFYHGRSLSNLADWEAKPSIDRTDLLVESVKDALKSIELYETKREGNREFIGATYNNIVYIRTLMAQNASDSEAAKEYLQIGSDALKNLKEYVPESEWYTLHPNYFHTDANLHYFLSISGFAEGDQDPHEMLLHAKRQISRAMTYVKKDIYLTLNDSIDNALRRMK